MELATLAQTVQTHGVLTVASVGLGAMVGPMAWRVLKPVIDLAIYGYTIIVDRMGGDTGDRAVCSKPAARIATREARRNRRAARRR